MTNRPVGQLSSGSLAGDCHGLPRRDVYGLSSMCVRGVCVRLAAVTKAIPKIITICFTRWTKCLHSCYITISQVTITTQSLQFGTLLFLSLYVQGVGCCCCKSCCWASNENEARTRKIQMSEQRSEELRKLSKMSCYSISPFVSISPFSHLRLKEWFPQWVQVKMNSQ